VKQARFVKLIKTNLMKDVAELKERFTEIMNEKEVQHKRQQKLFHKMAKKQQQMPEPQP